MDRRLQLHSLLKEILGSDNVYFQPPSNIQMNYPAIVYSRDYAVSEFAGNLPYRVTQRYQLLIIDRDPDTPILSKVLALPRCTYVRNYKVDGLNHDVCSLYF